MGSPQKTHDRKVIIFSCICVEIDLSNPLLDYLEIHVGTYSCMQQLDYETFPFHCQLCHEYGHLQQRCPKTKYYESQSTKPPRNPPKVEKGKTPILGDVSITEGFILVKDHNTNCGKKSNFKEWQDGDTFNRFDVLDDLSQQEVNMGMMALDQGVLEMVQEGNIYDNLQNTQDVGALQMDIDLNQVDSMVPKALVAMQKIWGGISFFHQISWGPIWKKAKKASPSLGLRKKNIKKGLVEKASKARRKDLKKIKMMGEMLVELGSIKNLDSHFSNPQK